MLTESPREFAVTFPDYSLRGGIHIPLNGAAATVSLRPVVLLPLRRLRGPSVLVDVPPKPVVDYSFAWQRQILPLNRRHVLKELKLVARQDIRLARIVLALTEGAYQPLRITDGEVVQAFSNLELHCNRPYPIPVGISFNAPCWISCFAPDDDVDLRDPPPKQRRLR